MKFKNYILFTGIVFSLLSLPIFAEEELTRVTIFDNLSLIERVKRIELKEGINEVVLTPVSTKIILDSVYPSIENAEFVEQEYTSNSLIWKIKSEEEKTSLLRVFYLISGLKWTLNYRIKLNENADSVNISGWAKIENKSERDFYHSFLTLITSVSSAEEEKQVSYSLPFPLTFKNGEEKQIPLFLYKNVPLVRKFLFDADKYGNEVREEMVFKNNKENGLGFLFPQGEVYIYEEKEGRVFFVSKDNFPSVLPGREGSICLGQAKSLKGERVQTFYQRLKSGEQEYAYRIILWNYRDIPVKIKVREYLYGEGEILESEPLEYTKEGNLIFYEVEIPPKGKREVRYKARIK